MVMRMEGSDDYGVPRHPQLPAPTSLPVHLPSPSQEAKLPLLSRSETLEIKLNIHSKQRPELRRYINWLERSLDRKMFLSGPRCSSLNIHHNTSVKQKDNINPELTHLALNSQPKNTKKSPHEIVQDFFLINDSTTVATELPVFIRPKEVDLDIDEPITGHIDLIQIRYDNLYILDYKPNLNHPENYASQLLLYKQAIHKRTSIPEHKIHTAAFNRHAYYEFE